MDEFLFPQDTFKDGNQKRAGGVILRDYIAIQAMQAIINSSSNFAEVVAKKSYEYADALLKERENHG